MTQDIYTEVQRIAEQRLADAEAVYDAEEAGQEPPDVELAGPYDGCPTCIVREVLDAARPYFAALVALQEFVHSAREGQDMRRPVAVLSEAKVGLSLAAPSQPPTPVLPTETAMTVKAKFYCSNVQTFDGATASSVTLGAVCRGVENAHWSSATPAGSITMSILNDLATAQFKKGQEYEVTFEPVDAPAEGDGHHVDPVKTKYGAIICGRCGGYPTLPGAGVDPLDQSTWPATAWDSHNKFYAVKS